MFRKALECRYETVEAFFLHGPSNTQQDDRMVRIRTVMEQFLWRRCGKPIEVQAVIDKEQALVRCHRPEMVKSCRRAGDRPIASGQFFAFLPIRRRPDILGVGRHAPRYSRQEGGIAGDRSGRVQEVCMQLFYVWRHLICQDNGLSEAPDPIWRRIAQEVLPPSSKRDPETGAAADRIKRSQNPKYFAVQILWQVVDRAQISR